MTLNTLLINSPLGKVSTYCSQYNPALLFPIARQANRDRLGVHGTLPFFGMDYWNAYEVSWLNARGKPQIVLLSLLVAADSPNIIESKSVKLYLNSFNQTRLSSVTELQKLLQADLSAGFGLPVQLTFTLPEDFPSVAFQKLEGTLLDRLDIEVDCYAPTPAFLSSDETQGAVTETLVSHLLKSNCQITGQPDWASIQISYSGAPIDQQGLLKYLISFREHNEFHEDCVERIFMDILRQCQPQKLFIYARYTRRGGIDINPWRSNFSGCSAVNNRLARQ